VKIPLDPEFEPNSNRGLQLSDKYLDAFPMVDYMWYEARMEQKVVFITVEQAERCGVHLQNASWAPKKGSVKGRNTTNCSGVSSKRGSQIPLNSKKVCRLSAKAVWGDIDHPTIIRIAKMILAAEAEHGREFVAVWKVDIKGAYPQFKIHPGHAYLMGSEMQDGHIMVNHAGSWGRVLRVNINTRIVGEAVVYVDDGMGVSETRFCESDMAGAGEQITILGSQAEAVKKRETTADPDNWERKIVLIGWEVNLLHRIIDVASENRLKALHLFWTTDLEATVPLEVMEP
jgi:hypothetical protein